jgi:hypothetical protein
MTLNSQKPLQALRQLGQEGEPTSGGERALAACLPFIRYFAPSLLTACGIQMDLLLPRRKALVAIKALPSTWPAYFSLVMRAAPGARWMGKPGLSLGHGRAGDCASTC